MPHSVPPMALASGSASLIALAVSMLKRAVSVAFTPCFQQWRPSGSFQISYHFTRPLKWVTSAAT